MALCVFRVIRSSLRRRLVALHTFVSRDWIQGHSEMHFSWTFGVCAYSDTVLVLFQTVELLLFLGFGESPEIGHESSLDGSVVPSTWVLLPTKELQILLEKTPFHVSPASQAKV